MLERTCPEPAEGVMRDSADTGREKERSPRHRERMEILLMDIQKV